MDDEDIFEMFLEMMEHVDLEDPDGRMRVISKNPRYAADSPAAPKQNHHSIER